MAIRFRKYKNLKDRGTIINAIKLTPDNVAEVVAYVNKHKGTALDESILVESPDLRDGQYLAVKVAIVQRYWSAGRVRKGVRKAFRGDLIVRNELEGSTKAKPKYEFWRIRDAGIEGYQPV